jgi:Predicted phosphohydrolases
MERKTIKKFLKKITVAATLLIVFTLVYSYKYNHPVRFRPKVFTYAQTVYSLNPSNSYPDQLTLSPAEDSSRSVRLAWRTSPKIKNGEVVFWLGTEEEEQARRTQAQLTAMMSPELKADKTVHRFSAVLEGLEPNTSYFYKVGNPETGLWSEVRPFSTASENKDNFSFVYFGDTQASPEDFGRLLSEVDRRHRQTSLYLIAGDLVEDGEWRYIWDAFADNTEEVFSRKPMAPTPGNHDYRRIDENGVKYFGQYFNSPDNGPPGLPKGLSYSFYRQGVHFIVLDSNNNITEQTDWLEEQLQQEAVFKIVMFHHPPYHPKAGRSEPAIGKHWLPLFDRYQADLVLNGHDHSYLRTKKLYKGLPADENQSGTIYLASTSCEKFYDYLPLPEAEVQLARTLTYQHIAISYDEPGQARLTFRAFDAAHEIKDEFTLQKKLR